MKLSKKSEYALRALSRLGALGAPAQMSIQELADQEKIPKKFLEQVLLALKNAGILHSSRGKAGGYSLQRPAREVTLGAILRAVDGPVMPLPCMNESSPVTCPECPTRENCWLRAVMREVHQEIATMMDRVNLTAICRRAAQSHRSVPTPMYHI
jgi:Rrf2 family protein